MEPVGLYSPQNESENCGCAMIADLTGQHSHKIVQEGLQALISLDHRSATVYTSDGIPIGDGSGIMLALPHSFFKSVVPLDKAKVTAGQYGAGMAFLPTTEPLQSRAREVVERVANTIGLEVFHWRRVPINTSLPLASTVVASQPCIEQVFVKHAQNVDEKTLEILLFALQKRAEHAFRELYTRNDCSGSPWSSLYFCSLSCKTIVYKGMLTPHQLQDFFLDFADERFASHFSLVHCRFSTNTFPSWKRAQPCRMICHNGEINTLEGNVNAMKTREGSFYSEDFPVPLQHLYPVVEPDGSDSMALDNVMQFLVHTSGRSVPHTMLMLVPQAWQHVTDMDEKWRAFYAWHAHIMEPWDGPALLCFSDGRYLGSLLDRNGLRPARYAVTRDGHVVFGSETGILPDVIRPENTVVKGRLKPGKMFLIDFEQKRIISDREIKNELASAWPYKKWLMDHELSLSSLPNLCRSNHFSPPELTERLSIPLWMSMFNYTNETVSMILCPMASDGVDALGSMGNDEALACMSQRPVLLYNYFKQLFAQVTNPPIDPIREGIVMSLDSYVGPVGNLLQTGDKAAKACHRLVLKSPILTVQELMQLKYIDRAQKVGWKCYTLDCTFGKTDETLEQRLDDICAEALSSVDSGYQLLLLSDRNIASHRVPIPMLLVTGAVHHHLIRHRRRKRVGLIIETAEARELHHHCLLLGFGADAICPFFVYELLAHLISTGDLKGVTVEQGCTNYIRAVGSGILKVISKLGISTLESYKGAQRFEAIGLNKSIISKCFVGVHSRLSGIGFERLHDDAIALHTQAFNSKLSGTSLHSSGSIHWRPHGSAHLHTPDAISNLQHATRTNSRKLYESFARLANEESQRCALRGLLKPVYASNPTPIEEVESVKSIVRRFVTGGMSYGSISQETHETLAMAMNHIGARSNSGEGGETPERWVPSTDGKGERISAIKQVASARFGVTIHYLTNCTMIQIKMAQGAKPGEGGELPGHKVTESIAAVRHSTPGVGLISPPPHHDIYSIEDLAQLIYDVKCANPSAYISVKLVSKVGVGVVASGVAKAKADHILISGHEGGTGAARWTSIKHTGLPWELGLAETHQTLSLNGLRDKVILQTDGGMRTGLDVIFAAALGAEEFGFGTTPLITLGCIMMRKCHENTCPVGIATQDPELRKKFSGQPEHLINYFFLVAEEVRELLSRMGLRSMDELVGRTDLLEADLDNPIIRQNNLDVSLILHKMPNLKVKYTQKIPSPLDFETIRIDKCIVEQLHKLHTIQTQKCLQLEFSISNTDRTVGAFTSHVIAKVLGPPVNTSKTGLPDNTIQVTLRGSAGQSFGAWAIKGLTLRLIGDANDYVGKGLSGGRIIIHPSENSLFDASKNAIIGNVALYGATSGEAFICGKAAERFAVRNSGAIAVVEGIGDHGCEYMTGGRIVVLGSVGRNFAAGMSGGIAYVYDPHGKMQHNCNMSMVSLEGISIQSEDAEFLQNLVEKHARLTHSRQATLLLSKWEETLRHFVKVLPHDYKRVLERSRKHGVSVAPSTAALPPPPHIKDIEDVVKTTRQTKLTGFMRFTRKSKPYRHPSRRVNDFNSIELNTDDEELKRQTSRCMDCGIPYCMSNNGCPLHNIIPEFNDLVYKDQWKQALERLLHTNNFPEFTGATCPAPCEGACTLQLVDQAVTIKNIELEIISRGWREGWITSKPPAMRTGKRVAIIGSGPAGLTAADQLNGLGHLVTIYERDDRPGGLLMYGIPPMKLEKYIVERRIRLMETEGVKFILNTNVGVDIPLHDIRAMNDAVIIATGAKQPKDLLIPGRSLKGIHFAMDLLAPVTKSLLDSNLTDASNIINPKGKRVVVIGAGDTATDCCGIVLRLGCKSVVTLANMDKPPEQRDAKNNPWPQWPRVFRVDYAHEEYIARHGKDTRQFNTLTKEFIGDDKGNLVGLRTARCRWITKGDDGMQLVEEYEEIIPCDLVFIAIGYRGVEPYILEEFGVKHEQGVVHAPTPTYMTDIGGIFAAGDCRRGQSLVVWAIQEGRAVAEAVDSWLTHEV